MRQRSGPSSDDDGTDETLRERKNVARERSGDNDGMLLGSILLQHLLLASLTVGNGNTRMT